MRSPLKQLNHFRELIMKQKIQRSFQIILMAFALMLTMVGQPAIAQTNPELTYGQEYYLPTPIFGERTEATQTPTVEDVKIMSFVSQRLLVQTKEVTIPQLGQWFRPVEKKQTHPFYTMTKSIYRMDLMVAIQIPEIMGVKIMIPHSALRFVT